MTREARRAALQAREWLRCGISFKLVNNTGVTKTFEKGTRIYKESIVQDWINVFEDFGDGVKIEKA